MRAVHAVHRREQRILALGLIPSTTDHLYRQGHRTCRLMAGDAGAPVLADGFKEGMADGIHGACGVHQADAAESVWIGRKSGQRLAAGRRPPVAGRRLLLLGAWRHTLCLPILLGYMTRHILSRGARLILCRCCSDTQSENR